MNKKLRAVKRICCFLMSAFICLAGLAAPFADVLATNTVKSSVVTTGDESTAGKILVNSMTLYDKYGNERQIDSGKDYTQSIAELLTGLESGKINATKDSYFENEQDAKDGIVKIVFDVAGRASSTPQNVVFIADESGSMNMANHRPDGNYTSSCSPCLNTDHYYRIEYRDNNNPGVRLEYYLKMSDVADYINVWKDSVFIAAIKKQIARDVYSDESQWSSLMLLDWNTWKFCDNHYYMDDQGAFAKIPCEGESHVPFDSNYVGYFSPGAAAAGDCYDRMMMYKQSIQTLSKVVLSNNETSKIGYIGFSGNVKHSAEFKHYSPDSLPDVFYNTDGYNNTIYASGINAAIKMLDADNNSVMDDPTKTSVIFITDGVPEDSESSILEAINKLKALSSELTVYCIGIKSGNSSLLSQMSTLGSRYYKDCATRDEFIQFMQEITDAVTARASFLVDILGTAFNLVCDVDHPITARAGTEVNSYADIESAKANGIAYDTDGKTISWHMDSVSSDGARLSFYVKLQEPKRESGIISPEGFDTNVDASIQYTGITNGVVDSTPTKLTLENPGTVYVSASILTAEKTSDKTGLEVKSGDLIEYTVALKNNGIIAIADVLASDVVPDGTEFVSSENCALDADLKTIRFSAAQIAAGETLSFKFTVRVTDKAKKQVVNSAKFAVSAISESKDLSGEPACFSNTLVNPLGALPFKFSKVDSDSGAAVEGVKFKMYRLNCADASHDHSGDAEPAGACYDPLQENSADKIFTSDSGGIVDFGLLGKGVYFLEETSPAQGYARPAFMWKITVDPAADTPIAFSCPSSLGNFQTIVGTGGEVEYVLVNIPEVVVPATGGPGTWPFFGLGFLLAASGAGLAGAKGKSKRAAQNQKGE